MMQNYYILAGLIGVYSMVKTGDPVVILVVGILSMFCFTLGFSDRLKLSESNKIYLWGFRGLKFYFSFWIGFVLVIIMSVFMDYWAIWWGFFMAYQIISIVFWWTSKKYLNIKHPWLV
jgi:hypothetical protein